MFKVRLFGRDTLAWFRDLRTGDQRCRDGNHAQYLWFPRQPVELSHNWRLRSDAPPCSGQRAVRGTSRIRTAAAALRRQLARELQRRAPSRPRQYGDETAYERFGAVVGSSRVLSQRANHRHHSSPRLMMHHVTNSGDYA